MIPALLSAIALSTALAAVWLLLRSPSAHDLYAAHAMTALMQSSAWQHGNYAGLSETMLRKATAAEAKKWADAMVNA